MELSNFPGLATKQIKKYGFAAYQDEADYIGQVFNVSAWPGPLDFMASQELSDFGEPDHIPEGQRTPTDELRETWPKYFRVIPYRKAWTYPAKFLEATADTEIARKLRGNGESVGKGFRIAQNRLAFDVFNKGAFTAGDAATFSGTPDSKLQTDPYPAFIYDGKPFFGTGGTAHYLYHDHAQTFANLGTEDPDYDGIIATELVMTTTNAKDERGLPIDITPTVIVCPPALKRALQQVLESSSEASGGLGEKNVIQGDYSLVTIPYLTDTDAWFMGIRGLGLDFWKWGDLDVQISFDGTTRVYTVDVEGWFGVGVSEWRGWYANKLATS